MMEFIATNSDGLEWIDRMMIKEFGDHCVISREVENTRLIHARYEVPVLGRVLTSLPF